MLEELDAHEDEVDQELLRILPHVIPKVADKMMKENCHPLQSDEDDVIQ